MVCSCYRRAALLLAGVAAFGSRGAAAAAPAEAVNAFNAHIRATEARLDDVLQKRDAFLWADNAEKRAKLRKGGVICNPRIGKGDLRAPGGLIHHWVGAVFIPGATVARVLELIQDYDNHKNTYKPKVIRSRMLERSGNDFRVQLRLLERRLGLTVVLDTEYDVHYNSLGGADWSSRSYSTRIVEIANPGKRQEREKTAAEDRGFLWRLHSYWLFRERDGGTYVECEAVSLSRDIPLPAKLMDPVVRRFIRGLPEEFLADTLRATSDLVLKTGSPAGH